jgi:uncharacterized protein YeaC (DUF1315 family)
MSDPLCKGTAWRVLANAPSAWDIQIFLPEVAVLEAVAGYQRRLTEALAGVSSWEKKLGTLLGLTNLTKTLDNALKESAASYPDQFQSSLNELGAKILAPPDVDHIQVVQRAVSRRRPCDQKGDGYRDTLNWLTVLALASQHPDDQIVWVSDNSRDFGSDDGTTLHEDLIRDLEAIGAQNRVRWIRTLADLVLALAAEHTSNAPGTLKEIQARLHEETLRAFISSQVLAVTAGTVLDPKRCGLPVITSSAKVATVGDPTEIEFTVRGTAADNETAVEFELEASTSIELDVPPGTAPDITGHLTAASLDAAGSTIQTTKQLKFRGLITLDRFDRPLGGELTGISAREDDPGLAQWAISDLSRSLGALGFSTIPPEVFQRLKLPVIPPEVFQQFKQPVIPPEVFQRLKLTVIPPEVFQRLKLTVIPPEVFQRLKLPVTPPEMFQRLRMPASQPLTDAQPSDTDNAESGSAHEDQSDNHANERDDSGDQNDSDT